MTDKKPVGRQASPSTLALRSYLKANLASLFAGKVFTVSDLEAALPADKSATGGEDVKNLKVVLSNQLKTLAAEGVVALTTKPADAVSKKGKPANYYKLA